MAINYIHLARLINLVPHDLNRKTKKDPLPKKTRQNVVEKDKGVCFICSKTFEYGSSNPYLMSPGERPTLKHSHIHHVIPNGSNDPENLVTLCGYCHQAIHLLLFIEGKWNYTRPI